MEKYSVMGRQEIMEVAVIPFSVPKRVYAKYSNKGTTMGGSR